MLQRGYRGATEGLQRVSPPTLSSTVQYLPMYSASKGRLAERQAQPRTWDSACKYFSIKEHRGAPRSTEEYRAEVSEVEDDSIRALTALRSHRNEATIDSTFDSTASTVLIDCSKVHLAKIGVL